MGAVLVAGALGTLAGEAVGGGCPGPAGARGRRPRCRPGSDPTDWPRRCRLPRRVGLARGARGDLPLGDDVGECQPSAGAEHTRRFGEDPALAGREVDHAVGDHGVERAVVEGQLLDSRAAEAHVRVAAEALGLGELLGRDVDPADRALRADLRGGCGTVHAGAAAQVEYVLARERVARGRGGSPRPRTSARPGPAVGRGGRAGGSRAPRPADRRSGGSVRSRRPVLVFFVCPRRGTSILLPPPFFCDVALEAPPDPPFRSCVFCRRLHAGRVAG